MSRYQHAYSYITREGPLVSGRGEPTSTWPILVFDPYISLVSVSNLWQYIYRDQQLNITLRQVTLENKHPRSDTTFLIQPIYEDEPSNPLKTSMMEENGTQADFDVPPRVAGRKTHMGMHCTTQTRAAKHHIMSLVPRHFSNALQTCKRLWDTVVLNVICINLKLQFSQFN